MEAAARAQAAYDPLPAYRGDGSDADRAALDRRGPSLAGELDSLEKAAHVLHEMLDGLAQDLGLLLAPELDGVDVESSPSIAAVEAPRAPVVAHIHDLWGRVDAATGKVERLRKRLQVAPR